MKQVKPSIYDQDYYQRVYGPLTTASKLSLNKLAAYHRDIIKICPPVKGQFIVDFGCGNGNLSFYLAQKYPVKVLGIDYSSSAIKICKNLLSALNKNSLKPIRLQFRNLNNDQLPDLKNVDTVYLCDVVEHMYDHEIKAVFRKFLAWNPNIKIVIHTDNLIYLKYVRPFLDLLGLLLGQGNPTLFKQRQIAERRVHINLTSPDLFRDKMNKLGLRQSKRSYPTLTSARIKVQLGPLSQIPLLPSIVALALRLFGFLSPSFFAVYEARV